MICLQTLHVKVTVPIHPTILFAPQYHHTNVFQSNAVGQPVGSETSSVKFYDLVSKQLYFTAFLGKTDDRTRGRKTYLQSVCDCNKQVNLEELHGYSRLCTQAAITVSFHGDLTVLTGMVLS